MYANINGAKIFFDVAGKQYVPDGPVMRERPVCFVLHGGPGLDHTVFLPDLMPLADTMQLIFVDDRGCGRSPKCDISTCSMEQNAEDIEALRQYLGLDKVYILGHSYGGMKGQVYGIKYSEHLHGLILCCTAPSKKPNRNAEQIIRENGTEEQLRLWQQRLQGLITDENEYDRQMVSLYHHRWNDEMAQKVYEISQHAPTNNEISQYQRTRDMSNYNMTPDLHKIKCPVQIFSGKYDFVTSAERGKEIHDAIPQSEYHLLEEASHELFRDMPDEVFALIRDFVGRTFQPQK